MDRALEIAPQRRDYLGDLAYVQARAGRRADALRTLERAKQRPIEPFTIGRAYVALEQNDSAFAWLSRPNWKWPHRAYRADPALDPIRKDKRFSQLNARIEREMGVR